MEPDDTSKVIILHESDNVATALEEVVKDTVVTIPEHHASITVVQNIHFGHKFALMDIAKGEKVYKYGVPIGVATEHIKKGEHVHVHNLQTLQREVNESEGI